MSHKEHKHTNALAKETSPYLLQHAHNPVNWYPWGDEAFEKARKEDKPIFLSVGYSSCHWCHVMERESFEKEDVAEIVNKYFVAIKVDREERPDVDEIYMTAVQIVTQHGGWPMTVFMNAEGKPFFGGTYFPPEDRGGRMGFKSMLERVHDVWTTKRKNVLADCESLSSTIREHMESRRVPAAGELNKGLLNSAVDDLYENFDKVHGGFGARPKFPPNSALPYLNYVLENNLVESDAKAREIATKTLDEMALGGIHDHLAGGFHRYSTDERWLLPHFEKMLYDNAMLSRSYAQASVVFKNPEYARIARGVYDWVLREMTSPEGGFYSTLDADSDGEEGKFYVWNKKEVEELLGADAALFCELYNIKPEGNFKDEASGHQTEDNIPHLTQPLPEHAQRLKLSADELQKKIDACKAKLMAVRVKRVWPALDDKVLTAWNGLMISSFADGSIRLNEPRYKDAAVKAAEFMLKNQRTKEGRWLATHRKGQSKLPAYLDDHAFMAVAFLDLFEATKDERWKNEAVAIVKLLDDHFADAKGGGYFFTADDHEKLLARTKDPIDKAIPAGNGWAAQALVRLAKATGDKRYADQAAALFREFQGFMERAPQATESMLLATAEYVHSGFAPAETVHVKAQSRATKGPVTVELVTGEDVLRRGTKVRVAVRFTIDKPYHVQAHTPDNSHPSDARVTLLSKALGKFEVKYPKAEKLAAPELGGDLQVYSGDVVAGGYLEIPEKIEPGPEQLVVKVRFQACDDKACLAPEELTLSLVVVIAEKDSPVKRQHESLFELLKLGAK